MLSHPEMYTKADMSEPNVSESPRLIRALFLRDAWLQSGKQLHMACIVGNITWTLGRVPAIIRGTKHCNPLPCHRAHGPPHDACYRNWQKRPPPFPPVFLDTPICRPRDAEKPGIEAHLVSVGPQQLPSLRSGLIVPMETIVSQISTLPRN